MILIYKSTEYHAHIFAKWTQLSSVFPLSQISRLVSVLFWLCHEKADWVFLRASAQSHFADFGSISFNCDVTIYLTFPGLIFKSRRKKWRIATEWLQKILSAD